jgi:hypothetical protein
MLLTYYHKHVHILLIIFSVTKLVVSVKFTLLYA